MNLARKKLSEIQSTSNVFTFLDKHEQSIDDGGFYISPYPLGVMPNAWMKLRSDRHAQELNPSFLDGHAEGHTWRWPKRFRDYFTPATDDLQDLRWLQSHLPPGLR